VPYIKIKFHTFFVSNKSRSTHITRFCLTCLADRLNVSTLHSFLVESELNMNDNVDAKRIQHVRGLGTTFRDHLPLLLDDNWSVIPSVTLPLLRHTHWVRRKTSVPNTDWKSFESLPIISFWLCLWNNSQCWQKKVMRYYCLFVRESIFF
jgi:hypothetical protein